MSTLVRTPQDLLKFGIQLAETNLTNLRDADLKRMRRQLASALGRDSGSVDSVRAGVLISRKFDGPSPDRYGVEDLARLQVEVTRLLRPVTAGAFRPLQPTSLAMIRVMTLPYRDRSLPYLQGTVTAVFLHILLLALSMTDNRVVRRCPVCSRLLAADGKRRYCNRRCTNRASMKKYLERNGRESLRLAKRREYQQRVLPGCARPYKPRQLSN